MLKRTALMESISSNLHSFLKKTGKNLPLTDKKFLRDSLIGLIRAGQPVVCKMARHLPNQRTKFISRLDRLDQHLIKDSTFDSQVKQTLPELWLPYIQEDTPIILDLSDIAKPSAKMMDYLATVRDGSTGQLVNGYWLVEMYASVSHKNPIPILLEPFSHQEPYAPGQNPVVIDAIHRIFDLTDKRGVLIADRGFDAIVLYDDWLDNDYRFVVRLVGSRHLLRFCGDFEATDNGQWRPILAHQLAEQTPTPHRFYKLIKRKGRPTLRFTQIGWVEGRRPGREKGLTLVGARMMGRDTTLMLLTNLPGQNGKDDKR